MNSNLEAAGSAWATWRNRFARLSRITVTPTGLMLLVVAYLLLTQNQSLARAVVGSLPKPFGWQEWRIALSALITTFNVLMLAMIALSWKPVQKPAACVLLVTAAVCSYFMDSFGTLIDKSMIMNVARTDFAEASDLMSGAFWTHVAVFGLLPAVVVWKVRLRRSGFWKEFRTRAALLMLVLTVQAAVLGLQYNELSFWGRENRSVAVLINPVSPINSAYSYLRRQYREHHAAPLLRIAGDATRAAVAGTRPLLVVMVVGETARAQNFQLDGYGRSTNPALSARRDLFNFSAVRSCGTATAESVPCMFSNLGQQRFSPRRAAEQENVLDVLHRLGVRVAWWDNDSGCQGVCSRVGSISIGEKNDPRFCTDGQCLDGALLSDLGDVTLKAEESMLLVLHMKGSHGPAYFKRYPESARRFTPDCRDENVQRCSLSEVVNAYDNSIVYTDSVLSDLIGQLDARSVSTDSVVLYVSDHGESLGEAGLYLHGIPYRLAPDQQTHVPMFLWLSAQASSRLKLDTHCLAQKTGQPTSHDAAFHTLMGLFSVRSKVYDPTLDLLSACQDAG